nr:hypothetical protein BaRGS_020291 [Batillaria attramentaria]
MEKPKFSFAAPCAKIPYCLDEENKVQVPASLNQYLRDYQREGIRFLYSHYIEGRGAILGDDMGLGKTVQVIGFLSALLGKEGTRMDVMRQKPRFIRMMSDTPGLQDNSRHLPFLIIGPGSVLYNWLEEFETWGHFTVRKYHGADKAVCLAEVARGKVEVVVTTFETFRDNVVSLNAVDWEAVIVDEVHRIKGMKAQTTLALRTVPCLCRYGLTGTALQNNMSELWCILDWAQPEVLGSPENFVEEFVKPIERGQKHNATKRELAEARRKKDAFAKVRSQMMLRRTKKLIADQLPRKTDRVVFCRLTPLQVSVYKAVLSHPDLLSVLNMSSPCSCGSGAAKGKCCHQKTRGGRKLWSVMFSFMHVLLKTANHVALLIPHARTSPEQKQRTQNLCEIAFKDHPEFISQTQEAAFRTLSDPKYCGKMKVLQGMLSVFAKSHSKVLVFSYSTRLLDILEQHVISVGHEYRRIDGKVTGYKRQKIVREFNSDPNIFLCLISTKAGGLGLNMTGANKVVIFDPNWNPSHDLQAQDRAYRIGQRRDVEVFRLISAGTIEENIYLRQIYKQQLGNVAVGTENARRYFHGIQGDASNKGELFGVKNMFQLRTGNSCLTMDILHRNAKVEAGIAGHDMADYIPSSREQELAKGDMSLEEESDSVQDDEYSDDDESFFGLKDLFDAADTGDGASPKSVKTKARELPEDPLQSTSRERGAHGIPHKKNQHCEKGDLDETLEDDRSASRLVPAEGRGLRTGKSTASPKAKRNTRDEKSKRKEEKVSSPLKCTGIGDKKTEEREGGRAFHQALFDDSMKTPSFSSVSSVFEECGVIHVHDNPQVVGASRVEDYMSRCAVQDVFELKINTQAPALLCDPLSQDDSVDCFADSSLWKKRKKVRKLPPKKIDRLLQETKDDYQELFESGRLVRKRKEGEAEEETGARLGLALVVFSLALVVRSLSLMAFRLALVVRSLALVVRNLALVVFSLALVVLSLALVVRSLALTAFHLALTAFRLAVVVRS